MLLDLCLDGADGRDLLVELRSTPATEDVPIAIFSVLEDPAVQAECYSLGADAFFCKPIEPATLTGLLNRRGLQEEYIRLVSHSARHSRPLALAVLDFDNFKRLNDTYGHLVGDDVLRGSAQVLRSRLRAGDVLGRWGGEEFVILFPSTTVEGARRALDGALVELRAHVFRSSVSELTGVTFSAGIVDAHGSPALGGAVARADRPLYIAKASGRGMVLGPEARLAQPAARVLLLEDDVAIVHYVSSSLLGEGIELRVAGDLAAARAALREDEFDLAVFDRLLPDGDSLELVTELRADPRLCLLPVLVGTSLDAEDELARSFEAGADDYITKPYSRVELISRLRRLLARSRSTPTALPILETP